MCLHACNNKSRMLVLNRPRLRGWQDALRLLNRSSCVSDLLTIIYMAMGIRFVNRLALWAYWLKWQVLYHNGDHSARCRADLWPRRRNVSSEAFEKEVTKVYLYLSHPQTGPLLKSSEVETYSEEDIRIKLHGSSFCVYLKRLQIRIKRFLGNTSFSPRGE